MIRKQRRHSVDLKAKVALAAIREEGTLAELSSKYSIHATQIQKWKKAVLDAVPGVFDAKGQSTPKGMVPEAEVEALYNRIGKLEVERDFLSRALGR